MTFSVSHVFRNEHFFWAHISWHLHFIPETSLEISICPQITKSNSSTFYRRTLFAKKPLGPSSRLITLVPLSSPTHLLISFHFPPFLMLQMMPRHRRFAHRRQPTMIRVFLETVARWVRNRLLKGFKVEDLKTLKLRPAKFRKKF